MTDFGRRIAAADNVLPKTGQITQYYPLDDGALQVGWEGDRFTDNGDGTISDAATGLMWPADWTGLAANNLTELSWEASIDYAAGLVLAGHSDWRMPNINEYLTITDNEQLEPAMNPVFTVDTEMPYWSSTTVSEYTPKARAYYPWDGTSGGYLKTYTSYAMCVRQI